MTAKVVSRSLRNGSLRVKPKLSLFGHSSAPVVAPPSPLELIDESWLEERTTALHFVQRTIVEQEDELQKTLNAFEATKSLALGRLETGINMSLAIAVTQLKNTEAVRDHLFGVIGSLEHLCSEIEESETTFDWRRRCAAILEREPLRFSVKEENSRSFSDLQKLVHVYCQHSQ